MDIPAILSSGALEQGAFFVFSVVVLYLSFMGNKDNKQQVEVITKDNKEQVLMITEKYAESIDKHMLTSMDKMEKMEDRFATERREIMGWLRDEKRGQ